MSGAYCKKHDEFEPYHWDFQNDGLWVCSGCSKESMKRLTKRLPNGMKPLDYAIQQVEKNFSTPQISDKELEQMKAFEDFISNQES